MSDFFAWFLDVGNSKIAALLIFFFTFSAILVYVYGSKKRSKRLETYRNIPFLDDDDQRVPGRSQKKAGE